MSPATFELERFAWEDGAFQVAGRWMADDKRSLGRARLVVEVDGRRRRIGAQGGKHASAGAWSAHFGCQRRPSRVGPAELEVGDLIIDLPKPELPAEPVEPAAPPPDVRGAEALLEQLRSERAETEDVARRLQVERERLKQEREAAEAAAKRLAEERQDAESAAKAARDAAEAARKAKPPAPQPGRGPEPPARPLFVHETPRREAIRSSLSLPREPRGLLPIDESGHQRELAYLVAFVIVIVIGALVVLLL